MERGVGQSIESCFSPCNTLIASLQRRLKKTCLVVLPLHNCKKGNPGRKKEFLQLALVLLLHSDFGLLVLVKFASRANVFAIDKGFVNEDHKSPKLMDPFQDHNQSSFHSVSPFRASLTSSSARLHSWFSSAFSFDSQSLHKDRFTRECLQRIILDRG